MRRKHLIVPMCLLLLGAVATGAPRVPWQDAVRNAAFVKEGLERLHNPQYQYAIVGLAGTTMRVGPYGFTRPGAPRLHPGGYLRHMAYLAYEYWWDDEAHRHIPFDLTGGYGENLEPGQVTAFREHLDIETGLLTIDLALRADLVGEGLHQIGRNAFQSRREIFVTPEGVLVIRVTDSGEASLPFEIRVDTNQQVRVYLNLGVHAKTHAPWSGTSVGKEKGLVLVAKRPRSCTATLAVALDTEGPRIRADHRSCGSEMPGKPITFYLAPGSSYESADAATVAWDKVARARERGFDALRKDTAAWWRAFYGKSSVSLPDPELAAWYVRSLYYHGVFFGNTHIPPGCNATSTESFAGAICPEYDLVFSQRALLYTSHLDESAGIVDWIESVLPRAMRYAKEGLTLHKTTVKYGDGAKYGTLMGFDGTISVPPTEAEGVCAFSNYPGANAAAMALAHADWTGDGTYDQRAKRILKATARVTIKDQQWREDFKGYLDKHMPNAVQQSAAIFSLRESLRRGVAEPGWEKMVGKIIVPTAELDGVPVVVVGPGAMPFVGYGDACWLSGLWWYGSSRAGDPLVRSTYDMIRQSFTGKYTFNNGWMGVFAAKLRNGEDAQAWAKRMIQPGVTLFDDTCFGELVFGPEDFKKTPEIAAHGALICNVTQMLLDPDSEDTITVFPAIPPAWQKAGVAFANLAAKGAISVSGEFTSKSIRVTLDSRSTETASRRLCVRLADGARTLSSAPPGTRVETGWAVSPALALPPKAKAELLFLP